MQSGSDHQTQVSRALVFALMALALGFMLSNMLRTLPAIAADVLMSELSLDEQELGNLTGAFHVAFALGQIPVGVALDRYRVRTVAMFLLATVVVGCALAAVAGGAGGFLLGQVVMGLGCCGLLLCPMTLALRSLDTSRFGLWAGLIQSTGAAGMLVSGTPMAWLVDASGWRATYWSGALIAAVVLVLVALLVPKSAGAAPTATPRRVWEELRAVCRIGAMPQLRGILVLAFVSFAAVAILRGLWGGPWLMDVKGYDRITAGHVLTGFTVALIVGPALGGLLVRRIGYRRLLLVLGSSLAASILLLLLAGGPGGMAPALGFGHQMPPWYDVLILCAVALSLGVYPQLFAMAREATSVDQAGKTLAAVNLAFFAGAAVLQPVSGQLALAWGVKAAILGVSAGLLVGAAGFAYWTRPSWIRAKSGA